jgi:hypothetical protein
MLAAMERLSTWMRSFVTTKADTSSTIDDYILDDKTIEDINTISSEVMNMTSDHDELELCSFDKYCRKPIKRAASPSPSVAVKKIKREDNSRKNAWRTKNNFTTTQTNIVELWFERMELRGNSSDVYLLGDEYSTNEAACVEMGDFVRELRKNKRSFNVMSPETTTIRGKRSTGGVLSILLADDHDHKLSTADITRLEEMRNERHIHVLLVISRQDHLIASEKPLPTNVIVHHKANINRQDKAIQTDLDLEIPILGKTTATQTTTEFEPYGEEEEDEEEEEEEEENDKVEISYDENSLLVNMPIFTTGSEANDSNRLCPSTLAVCSFKETDNDGDGY